MLQDSTRYKTAQCQFAISLLSLILMLRGSSSNTSSSSNGSSSISSSNTPLLFASQGARAEESLRGFRVGAQPLVGQPMAAPIQHACPGPPRRAHKKNKKKGNRGGPPLSRRRAGERGGQASVLGAVSTAVSVILLVYCHVALMWPWASGTPRLAQGRGCGSRAPHTRVLDPLPGT